MKKLSSISIFTYIYLSIFLLFPRPSTAIKLFETFGNGIPPTWTVVDGYNDGITWTTVDPTIYQIGAPFTNPAVGIDSHRNSAAYLDEQLISPTIDFSQCTGGYFYMDFANVFKYYASNLQEIADVDISPDNGNTWTNVLRMTGNDFGPEHRTLNITSFASGNQIKIRFRYYNARDEFWWLIDDVNVYSMGGFDGTTPVTTASPPGGTFTSPQLVRLNCDDGAGCGCGTIYYATDGTTPTTSSPSFHSAWHTPIPITETTTLKFFARDDVGNSELVKTEVYTISIMNPSKVLTWGRTSSSNVPVPVTGLSGIIDIAGGGGHSLALKSDGTVWAWGNNGSGQLGNGTYTSTWIVPVQVNGLSQIVAIAGGGDHSLALKSDGTVWAWGDNNSGQLGNGTNTKSNLPVQVTGLSQIVAIAGGGYHSLALKSDGTVWDWGDGYWYGQLGNGTDRINSNVPVPVTGLTGIVAVAEGWMHSLALKSDGTVWAWGSNNWGQLGNNTSVCNSSMPCSNVPVQVTGLSQIVDIAGGGNHSLALKSDGTVWAWGDNENGQLGDGTNTYSYVPVPVAGLTGIDDIAAGGGHSLALKSDGTVWAWGNNGSGQLGDDTNVTTNLPVQVTGLSGVEAIAGGGDNSVALRANTAPVASAGGPYSADLGSGITFDGTGSHDPDTGDSIISYSWSIATYTLTGPSPLLTAAEVNALGVGTYPVSLTVTDTFGATGTASTTLAINTVSFTITTSPGVICAPNPVNYNSNSVCTITPTIGYHVADVLVDNVSVGAVASYLFPNITANHTITASFAINTYTLTYTAGTNGTITGTSPQTVNHGSSGSTVTAVPNTGYHFTQWSDGVTTASRTDTNVTGNINVTANFVINTYTLTYTAGTNGTISGTSPQTVNHGANGTLVTAMPNTGYLFTQWSDGVLNASRTDTNVTGNINVTASFVINTYTLTYTAGTNGTISGTSPQTVNHGSSGSTVTAAPNTGYHFVQWSDGVLTASRTDTNVTGNINVTANFVIDTFAVGSSVSGGHGTVSPVSQTVSYGGQASINITPEANYHIASITDNGASMTIANPFVISNVTAAHNVVVTFAIDTFTVSASVSGGHGTVSPASQTVNYGSQASINITPEANYHIASITDNGASMTIANTFVISNVTAAHNVVVTFAIDTYTVTPLAGANGSISPSSAQTVNYGGTRQFTVTPSTGYHIDTVSGCGGSLSGSTYTTGSITGDCTVTATFAINTYTLTYTAGANGTITGTSPQTVNHGSSGSTVTAVPNTGCHFTQWSDGVTTASRTETNVTGNINATANFVMDTYAFTGFFAPVENPDVVNTAKAGQAIPVKWRITDSNGGVSDPTIFLNLTSNYLTSYAVSCTNFIGDETDFVEEVASGSSGLQYNGDGYWQFNWKTPKTYSVASQQCRVMVLRLKDGSQHTANFKFTK